MRSNGRSSAHGASSLTGLAALTFAVLGWSSWQGLLTVFILAVSVYLSLRVFRSSQVLSGGRAAAIVVGLVTILILLRYRSGGVTLGLSFLFLRLVQLVLDECRGVAGHFSLREFLGYIFFPPCFLAGPVDGLRAFLEGRSRVFVPELFVAGFRRLLIGAFKKFVLLDLVLRELLRVDSAGDLLRAGAAQYQGPMEAWWALGSSFLIAYVDLSSYSDMAIGGAAMLGFRVSENMNRPYLAADISDFWRRWNITVARWCCRNIFFPVFGLVRNPQFAVLVSMTGMGLWHGVSFCWLLWGVYHAVGAMIHAAWARYMEKVMLPAPLSLVRRISGIPLTLGFVIAGHAFVVGSTPSEALWILLKLAP